MWCGERGWSGLSGWHNRAAVGSGRVVVVGCLRLHTSMRWRPSIQMGRMIQLLRLIRAKNASEARIAMQRRQPKMIGRPVGGRGPRRGRFGVETRARGVQSGVSKIHPDGHTALLAWPGAPVSRLCLLLTPASSAARLREHGLFQQQLGCVRGPLGPKDRGRARTRSQPDPSIESTGIQTPSQNRNKNNPPHHRPIRQLNKVAALLSRVAARPSFCLDPRRCSAPKRAASCVGSELSFQPLATFYSRARAP